MYKEIDKFTLECKQTVTYDDGSIEKIQVRDYVERGKLFCRVQSDRFGLKILEGRMEQNQIFWWRKEEGAIESYRERITASGKLYLIDGYGIYGNDPPKVYTFWGEYKKIR